MCMYNASGGPKRGLHPPGLEWQVIVNLHVGLKIEPRFSGREVSAPDL